jgi:Bacterial lectin
LTPGDCDATGGGGGLLGASGIRNGVGIAFDIFQNAQWGDIANDHMNFIKTDAPLDQARLSVQVDLGNIEDSKWHRVHVSWDVAQQALSYSFDGKPAGTLTWRPREPILRRRQLCLFRLDGSDGWVEQPATGLDQ